jgi:hypothetical protein
VVAVEQLVEMRTLSLNAQAVQEVLPEPITVPVVSKRGCM